MFYSRWWLTEELQTAVDHSDESYPCKKMSDCPFTGIPTIAKIPWANQANAEVERRELNDVKNCCNIL